jgi:hypothetical protein
MTLEGGTAYVDPGATASDLKDGMLTPSITSNTVESDVLGTYAVTWSATNSAGGTGRATRVVNVVDTTKPTLTVPTNIIVEATGASGATVSFSVSANDTVSGELTLSVEPASGSTFALGATTVNASVTDASGNMATGSFTVTVKDTTAPVVTVPTNITTEAAGPSGAVVSFTVSASDLVDGARATTLDHASESTFPIGTTTVNVTAQDTHGNIGSTSFTVTVRDTTAPVINPHPDVYALAPGLDGVVVNYDAATATEGVSTPTFSYSQDSGTVFPVGTTTVTVNAVDAAHNHAISTHFDVIVHLAGAVSEKRLAQGDDAPGAGTNGLPADAKLASFGTPATDDAGDLAFLAKWTGTMGGKAAKGGGLFLNDQCLAVVGGDASAIGGPGATWKSFTDPVVDAGHLVCIATLSGVPKSSASAVVCNLTSPALEKIARAGGEATDDGAKFKSFKAVEIVGTRLAWFAQLAPGTGTSPRTSAANDYGIWMHDANGARLMMRERQPLLDKTIKTLVSFVPGNGSPGQGRGWFVDAGGAVGSAVFARAKFTDQSQGVILETGLHFPDLRPLSIGGGGPGSPDLLATYFTSYGLPARNSRGTTLFRATLSTRLGGATKADARGIFFNTSLLGPYTPLVRTDDDAVSGAKFNAFKDPVLAEDGAIAFAATIKGGTVKGLGSTTLWWRRPGGQLTPLAQAGPLAAGEPNDLPAGAEWKTFPSLALAANRGPIFAATLIPHKGGVTPATASGVWAMDFDGKLRTLFRTGDQIDVGAPGTPVLKKVKSFKLLMATVGSTGVTRSFNDDAQVVWLATFVDKTTALVMTEVP